MKRLQYANFKRVRARLLKHNRDLQNKLEDICDLYNNIDNMTNELIYRMLKKKILQNHFDIKKACNVSRRTSYKNARKKQKILTKYLKSLVCECINLIVLHKYQCKDKSFTNKRCFVRIQGLKCNPFNTSS